MLGSLFAGLAFSNASLGAVHAMAHSLGGLLDLPHGQCNAILLEHVAKHNFSAAASRYRRIAHAMDIDLSDLPDQEAEKKLARGMADFRRAVGVDSALGQLGMTPGDIPNLAENALNDACLVTNPTQPALSDIERIYEQAL